MNNLIFDSNVIIDILTKRDETQDLSSEIFIKAILKKKAFLSVSQVHNLRFVIKRNYPEFYQDYLKIEGKIEIVKTPSYIDFENVLAKVDIEDYLIEISAKLINGLIITRDQKFLELSQITISPKDYYLKYKNSHTKIDFLDLKTQYLSMHNEMDKAIDNIISNTAFIGGKSLTDFNENFAKYIGTKYAIGVGNGTDALIISLKALGLKPGDEVLVPANSFIATSEAVTNAGGKVVFVDCHPDLYTVDVEKIEEKITAKTKVIIPVHLYGQAADMDPIMEIAKKHDLKILEDCAQAHGAKYKNQNVGTFGDLASFSFYPGKNLGAYGDGGAIVTNDDSLFRLCKMFANHGRIEKYNHEFEGVNSRLDGLQAAVLNVKLQHISDWNKNRRRVAELYNKYLADVEEIVLPKILSDVVPVYHLFVIRTDKRNELKNYLKENNISAGIHYPIGLPFLKAYDYLESKPQDFPVTYEYQNKLLSLPIYPEMTEEMVKFVSEKIRNFFV